MKIVPNICVHKKDHQNFLITSNSPVCSVCFGIGVTIRTHWKIQCLPYAEIFIQKGGEFGAIIEDYQNWILVFFGIFLSKFCHGQMIYLNLVLENFIKQCSDVWALLRSIPTFLWKDQFKLIFHARLLKTNGFDSLVTK